MRPMPGLTEDEHRCVIHEGPLRLLEKQGKVKSFPSKCNQRRYVRKNNYNLIIVKNRGTIWKDCWRGFMWLVTPQDFITDSKVRTSYHIDNNLWNYSHTSFVWMVTSLKFIHGFKSYDHLVQRYNHYHRGDRCSVGVIWMVTPQTLRAALSKRDTVLR